MTRFTCRTCALVTANDHHPQCPRRTQYYTQEFAAPTPPPTPRSRTPDRRITIVRTRIVDDPRLFVAVAFVTILVLSLGQILAISSLSEKVLRYRST